MLQTQCNAGERTLNEERMLKKSLAEQVELMRLQLNDERKVIKELEEVKVIDLEILLRKERKNEHF